MLADAQGLKPGLSLSNARTSSASAMPVDPTCRQTPLRLAGHRDGVAMTEELLLPPILRAKIRNPVIRKNMQQPNMQTYQSNTADSLFCCAPT
jgi:hypothetical protein